ncbi:Gfo/Idh/MocA family oxidoreductase [uncultured Draconibacterium sp.]|uniref:Gfo/Idh/MocA family protein n=1 Tax=uncultured Draconibacterium sp. TaxID=1573823 RepID=UPI0025EC74FD|nr:Gfo/Idh/MocA family oxidoreductase [uncultured Draconibacterium sp.]
MTTKNRTRRNFLKNASIGGAGIILAPTILKSCAPGAAPSDKIRIAHIGVGAQSQHEIKFYFVDRETLFSVATCDPFKTRRDNTAAFINAKYKERGYNVPEVESIKHYEEVLSRDDVDAVHITTPDHWHVPMSIYAARAGKHVMVAKPLGLSIDNFKILEKEVAANNVKFHYATQQRAQGQMIAGIDMIKSGAIGEIEQVDVWCAGSGNHGNAMCVEAAVPEGFDYDLWTGPAPMNPYCAERVTNKGSWYNYDFSIGWLGGWGAHPLDIMVWGIKEQLKGNYTCEGEGKYWDAGGVYNNIKSWDLKLKYDSGLKVNFLSSDRLAEKDFLHYRKKKHGNGTTFWGTKGWISLSRGAAEASDPELNAKLEVAQSTPKEFGQMFVDVIKGTIAETNPLDEAIMSDTISHMGDMAIRTGTKITWDSKQNRVIDNEGANQYFTRDMRNPYVV